MAVDAQRTISHYRLIERIGEGGMGEVWRAFDTSLEREVALKIMRPGFVEDRERLLKFEREARTIAALNHPSIVTVHSVEEHDGRRFFTMELIDGRTLTEILPAEGLPRHRFFELAVPMVEAVGAAHARGIVHGDLKPGNIMVTADGRVKILDFGLARTRHVGAVTTTTEDPTRTLSVERRISGTVPYMSPEQIQGKDLDPRSDVFSLGIILYEMATGRNPFGGETSADVLASVLKDRPRPPSRFNREVSRHLDRVIERCLAKLPAARPESAVPLHAELASLRRAATRPDAGAGHSIAVLPFVDMSAEQDQGYFCEGVADEIINAISRVENLRVASRTSSFQFRGANLDSREIADRLGVANLLEGSVRKAGNRIRISAQMISASDGYQLWAERYDRELRDIFAIQDEIAASIVEALEVTLSPRERRAIKQVATASVEAYDHYLRGRQHFRRFRRKSIEFAASMFGRALEIDPTYAGAWAGLADCHSYLYMFWEVTEEHAREADRASRRAVELDPDLAEAHVARGVAISLGGTAEEAAPEFETAARLNPKLFEAYYFCARGYYAEGDLERAVRGFRQAIEARPEDYQASVLLGSALAGLGRDAEATDAFRYGLDRAQALLQIDPGDARALYFSAICLVQLGEREEDSIAWAERALAMDPEEPQVLYNVACVYSLLGRTDRAIACVADTIAHGGWWRTWARNDPDLKSLRDDPRFRALVDEPEPGQRSTETD